MARAVKRFTVVLDYDEIEALKASVRKQIENIAYNCVREKLNLSDIECPNERIHVGLMYETISEDGEMGIEVEVEVDI